MGQRSARKLKKSDPKKETPVNVRLELAGLARVAGWILGPGGACCRLNCLCSRPRCTGEEMDSNIGANLIAQKKGWPCINLGAAHAPAGQLGIMNRRPCTSLNYDGLCSPRPGGILSVEAYLQPQKSANSKVNYEMRDPRIPDARSVPTTGVLV